MRNHRYQPEIQSWPKKAREDLEASRCAMDTKPPIAWVACFHCRQVAEKSLKALWLYQTNTYPKEHDLIALKTIINDVLPDHGGSGYSQPENKAWAKTDAIENAIVILDQYYVRTRYPEKKEFELTVKDAQQAINLAEKVLSFARSKIES
jgi:HEPN domain-containing protein